MPIYSASDFGFSIEGQLPAGQPANFKVTVRQFVEETATVLVSAVDVVDAIKKAEQLAVDGDAEWHVTAEGIEACVVYEADGAGAIVWSR